MNKLIGTYINQIEELKLELEFVRDNYRNALSELADIKNKIQTVEVILKGEVK